MREKETIPKIVVGFSTIFVVLGIIAGIGFLITTNGMAILGILGYGVAILGSLAIVLIISYIVGDMIFKVKRG